MTTAFLLLNLLMVFSSNLAAHRHFKNSNFSEQLVAAFLLYASQITFSILFLGVIVKNLGMLWIIILNTGISMLVVFAYRKSIKESMWDFYEKTLNFSKEIFRAKDFFLYLIAFLFMVQIISLLIKIYYLPPHVWDVFAYHLHPAAEWTQQNMIPAVIDSPVLRVNRNPMGTRLFHFWCAQFSSDIRWIELPQFIFGLLVPLVSYSLMLTLRIEKATAARYAILIYFIPLILIESRTCQDHLALTGVILMAVLYFTDVFYRRKSSRIFFLSLALGLLLGIKISALHIIFVFPLALLLSKGFSGFQILEFLKKNKIKLAIGLVSMSLLGSYWYFKNTLILKAYVLMAGKIFTLKVILIGVLLFVLWVVLRKTFKKYPVKIRDAIKINKKVITILIIIAVALGSYGVIKHIGLFRTFVMGYQSPAPLLRSPTFYSNYPVLKAFKSRFLKNILVFPFRIKDIGYYTSYTPDFLEKSGFGIQFFVFGLIAYIAGIFFVFKKKYRNSMMGFITVFSTVLLLSYFCYYFTPANYRMFMFFPVFGIILWAYFLKTVNFRSYYLKAIDVLIVIMILFNAAACFFEGNMDKNRWKTILTIDNPLDRTSIKYSFFFKGEDWQFIDSHIRPDEPIGYIGYYDSWIFPYFDNQLKRRIYHLRGLPGFGLKKIGHKRARLIFNPLFVKSLKQRGIHFIHINPQGARHLEKIKKTIVVNNKRVYKVTKNLYYFKW